MSQGSRKLHINFHISTFLESGQTPGFSRASSKCHPWSLRRCWGFLGGVFIVFEIMDVPRIHQWCYISIFRSLPSLKVVQLLGSPERHPSIIHGVEEDSGGSWEESYRFWHNGCPKDTLRKLHINFQISTFLESGQTPGFSRASFKCHPWSLRGRWCFLREVLVVFNTMDVPRIHQGSCVSIFRSLTSWKVVHLQIRTYIGI